MLVAILGAGAVIQVVVFIVGAVASLALVRPIAKAHLRMPAELRTGTAALTGARAVVLQRVDSDGGRVRIGGEEWSARAYFQITDPKTATYEVANYIQAIEQLTVTTLRDVIGGMQLEETLTSRDQINGALRGVLDEATGKWGIRVNRVELKAIDPPGTIKDAMEKQMQADRDKRAAILTAEGVKQSQILTAEGEKESAILKAEGKKQALVLEADGQSKAIETIFKAIHDGDADPKLLAYQYLQMLPQIAEGESNKVWIIPSEFTQALGQLSDALPRGSSTDESQ
jgi:regulator of protease activity HflC (stomatin/prohibitin superfamily)